MQTGYANNCSTGELRGSAIGCAENKQLTAISPVRLQMVRQQDFLSDLRQQHSALCDALMSVLSHDPREPVPATECTGLSQKPSCDFEHQLMQQNDDLHSSVRRVCEILAAIRL